MAIILWPTLLGCLAILVIGFGNDRLLGPAAAIGALVTFLTWDKLGGEFAAGRIDHHNIQMLCATAVFYLSLLPARQGRMGVAAGVLTAFCLVIGLEMLPFLVVLWGMMVLRHAFAEAGIDRWLLGFCASFAVAAPLLLAGQVPMSGWWVSHCDVLAPPLLALAAIGIAASLVPVALARALPHPAARLLVSLLVAGLGLWLAAPLLQPCLAGPYGSALPEVRAFIDQRIDEAQSALALLQERPTLLLRVMVPPLLIGLFALGAMWLMRDRITKPVRTALIQALVLLIAGFAVALWQIRAANLMSPALPFLGGFLAYAFMTIPRGHRLRAPAALALVLTVPSVVDFGANLILRPKAAAMDTAEATAAPVGTATSVPPMCRHQAAIAELASLPTSLLFLSGNLAPATLVYTPHSVTSAWYHRNSAAALNGFKGFEDRAFLQEALTTTGADYLVVCKGLAEERFIENLTEDGLPAWLIEVTEDRKFLRLFKIDQKALTRAEKAAIMP